MLFWPLWRKLMVPDPTAETIGDIIVPMYSISVLIARTRSAVDRLSA